MSIFTIIIIIAVLAALWLIGLYNNLVKKNIHVDEAWSDIDVQLKRRYDLIPNLIETVKGYAAHESQVLQSVISARSKASSMDIDLKNASAEQMAEFSAAQDGLSGALGKLFALSEAYPDLKANENFLELQKEISDTENKIQAARRFYNATVRALNTAILSFPANLIAHKFGFSSREFFDLSDAPEERENVKVSF